LKFTFQFNNNSATFSLSCAPNKQTKDETHEVTARAKSL